jgi:hypothetical protein
VKFNKRILQLLLAFLFAFSIIQFGFSGNTKFEDLALGTETSPYFAKNSLNEPIHISRIDDNEEPDFINTYINSGKSKTILFLGNSQTHSINQIKKDQINFIQILNDSLITSNSSVFCQSIPNANLQELLLSYLYWRNKFHVKTLVLPLFFDDLREDGIRDVFYPNLIKQRYLIPDSSSHIVKKINKNLRSYWSQANISKNNIELEQTVQEKVESNLNVFFNENVQSWNYRENVRGDFFVWLYKLRNTLFGIKANTVRGMIPKKYSDNMDALHFLLDKCKKEGVKVFLYIPPIRSDVSLPYHLEEYNKFKKDIKSICFNSGNDYYFADFDNIIPGNLWGYKESTNLLDKREVDYMHFKYEGHRILADSILKHLSYIR